MPTSQEKAEQAQNIISGGKGSVYCGFCNKKHSALKPACQEFKDLVAKLNNRFKGDENESTE